MKFKEYSALGKMALDSAKFYQDKFDMLLRTNKLKEKYNDLVNADSLNKLKKWKNYYYHHFYYVCHA